MDSRGINDLKTQDIGQHLDEILEVERVVKKTSFHAEDTLHKEADVPKEADIKETAKKTPKRSLATVAGGKYIRTLRLHFFNRPNDSELVLEVESTETS
ncbi:BnaA06g20650D [Brassica napus]|uniref:(rape) hypothetical protein n=1 Tax=Brassica napus TaxID=3708 RepID=A0A078G8T7_BRANA|nr:unnamed protein product [Brassica napus]CDY21796.1 BnaA06g20650D [Brassica napus]